MSTLYERIVEATVAANRRAAEAEARCLSLEGLVIAWQSRADRAEVEAQALYQMLPEHIRPTT